MYLFILFDTFSKSIVGIYDDEKTVKQKINNFVRNDIDNEISNYRNKILDENNPNKRQEYCMIIENLKVQLFINDTKNCYIKNGNVISRYIYYSKLLNDSVSPIFLYNQIQDQLT
jgi:hypothetical protein